MRVPDAARNAAERVTSEKVADGVWFLAGGSHNSVAIEMKDHLVLVEAPLNDARPQAVIEQVKKLVPGKPIRSVVNSHPHFDHAGGLRAAVAEGATIVTQADNEPYFERAFAQREPIRPDRWRRAGRKPKFLAVPATGSTSATRTRPVEVHTHRRQPAQRQLPDGLPAEGEAADRGRRLHAGARRTRRRRRRRTRTTSTWSTTSSA